MISIQDGGRGLEADIQSTIMQYNASNYELISKLNCRKVNLKGENILQSVYSDSVVESLPSPLLSTSQRRRRLVIDETLKPILGIKITSLLLVHGCLWIGRDIGDILIVDTANGKVLTQLFPGGSMPQTQGSHGNHLLSLIGNHVVANQCTQSEALNTTSHSLN